MCGVDITVAVADGGNENAITNFIAFDQWNEIWSQLLEQKFESRIDEGSLTTFEEAAFVAALRIFNDPLNADNACTVVEVTLICLFWNVVDVG